MLLFQKRSSTYSLHNSSFTGGLGGAIQGASASMGAIGPLTSLLLVAFTHLQPQPPTSTATPCAVDFKPQTHCLPGHQLRYTSPFALQPQYPSPIWGSPDSGTTLDLNSDIEPTGKLQQSPRELPGVLLWSPRSTLPLLTALLHPLLSSFPHTLPPSCQLQIYPDLIEKIFNFSFNNY